MTPDLRKRYQWHKVHGYPGSSNALRAARAEIAAAALGLRVVWEDDDDADLGDHEFWCPAAKQGKCKGHTAESARVISDPDHPSWSLASLSGIIEADANYRRVIEAELFSEAIEVLADQYAATKRGATLADVGACHG